MFKILSTGCNDYPHIIVIEQNQDNLPQGLLIMFANQTDQHWRHDASGAYYGLISLFPTTGFAARHQQMDVPSDYTFHANATQLQINAIINGKTEAIVVLKRLKKDVQLSKCEEDFWLNKTDWRMQIAALSSQSGNGFRWGLGDSAFELPMQHYTIENPVSEQAFLSAKIRRNFLWVASRLIYSGDSADILNYFKLGMRFRWEMPYVLDSGLPQLQKIPALYSGIWAFGVQQAEKAFCYLVLEYADNPFAFSLIRCRKEQGETVSRFLGLFSQELLKKLLMKGLENNWVQEIPGYHGHIDVTSQHPDAQLKKICGDRKELTTESFSPDEVRYRTMENLLENAASVCECYFDAALSEQNTAGMRLV